MLLRVTPPQIPPLQHRWLPIATLQNQQRFHAIEAFNRLIRMCFQIKGRSSAVSDIGGKEPTGTGIFQPLAHGRSGVTTENRK